MSKRVSRPPVSAALTRTMVWGLVFAYSVILVGRSTYQNFSMNKNIEIQKARIVELEKEKQSLQLMLIYYRTNAYKEIEARRRLNLRGKDEHVVVLPQAKSEPRIAVQSAPAEVETGPVPPYVSWWQLFFGK